MALWMWNGRCRMGTHREARTAKGIAPGRRTRAALVLLGAAFVLALAAAGTASGQTPPPANGDWYVATSTTLSGQSVTVNGNVIVPAGVVLDLNSVNLQVASTAPGLFGITVLPGGTLNVQGGILQPASPANTFRFEIHGAATIDGAQIQYMWGSNQTRAFGVQIYSSNVTISNSTIQFGTRGNVLVASGTPTLHNNRIQLSQFVEISTSSPWTCRLNSLWEAVGVYVINGSHPTMTNNVIVDNGQASSAPDVWAQYAASFDPAQCSYVYVYETFLGYGLKVDSASAEVTGGVIERNSWIDNAGFRQAQASNPRVYVYRYPYDQQSNPYTHSAGLMLSAAGGNYTGISINNNFDSGIAGQGGNAVVNHVTIGNHTVGAGLPRVGIVVGNGVNVHNATMIYNYYDIQLIGSGIATFEHLIFGTPRYSTGVPAIQVDWSSNGGAIKVYNTTFPPSSEMPTAIQLSYYGTKVDLYNCTITSTQIRDYGYGGSTITSYWIFQATVLWPNRAPVSYALGMVTSPQDVVIFAESLDANGSTPERWLVGFQKFTGGSGGTVVNSPLSFRVFANGTISDPFVFSFNATTRIELEIEDPFPPSLAVFYPLDGARFNSSAIAMAGNAYDVGAGVDYVEYSLDGGDTWIQAGGTLPEWRATLTLDDGVHSIWVRSVDRAGGKASLNISGVLIDTQPPVFEVWQPVLPTSPGQPLYTNATSVLLRGTAPGDAQLTLNGEVVLVTGSQFSKQLLLQEGFNVYTLLAVDAVANRHQVEFAIVSDTLRPSIYLSSPPENFATNRPTITVAGVTETDVSLLLNGVPVTVSGGVFSVQYSLTEGINTLRVEADDLAGNKNSLTRAVFFDTVAPSIVVEHPTPDFVTNQRDVEVRGTVEATISVVYIDGAPLETNKGAFSRVVRLDEGFNTIRIQAWDAAGNPGDTHVVVIVDTDPPSLSVTAPAYGALVTTTTVSVSGSWTGEATVTVDGVPVLSSEGIIDERVSLLEGENEIEVIAVDSAGNRQEYRILVFRDTVPPALSVNLPQTKLTTQLGAYPVAGNVEGAVHLLVNDKPVAVDAYGDFSILLPLNMGDNTLTITATDSAGNTATSIHTLERTPPPETPEGLFGIGEASYALLPAMLIIGVVGTFALLRLGRRRD